LKYDLRSDEGRLELTWVRADDRSKIVEKTKQKERDMITWYS